MNDGQRTVDSLIDGLDQPKADQTVEFAWTESGTRSTSTRRTRLNCSTPWAVSSSTRAAGAGRVAAPAAARPVAEPARPRVAPRRTANRIRPSASGPAAKNGPCPTAVASPRRSSRPTRRPTSPLTASRRLPASTPVPEPRPPCQISASCQWDADSVADAAALWRGVGPGVATNAWNYPVWPSGPSRGLRRCLWVGVGGARR